MTDAINEEWRKAEKIVGGCSAEAAHSRRAARSPASRTGFMQCIVRQRRRYVHDAGHGSHLRLACDGHLAVTMGSYSCSVDRTRYRKLGTRYGFLSYPYRTGTPAAIAALLGTPKNGNGFERARR